MFRFTVAVLLLTCAIVVAELPVAPQPRAAPPQISLVVVENVTSDSGAVETHRILRIGVRNGKLQPAEKVWEGDQRLLSHYGTHTVVRDRYFVTQFGGVIDMRDGKVLHKEQDGKFCAVEGTKVMYRNLNGDAATAHSFDFATGKAKKEANNSEGKYAFPGVLSPDGSCAIESGPVAVELVLHQVGQKPKSLGKGFNIEVGPLASTFGPVPILWLDNGTFLTQRGNGKLVTVDLAGKVTEVLTIKDAPKDLVSAPHLFRDGSNRIVYSCGREVYTIDVAKKTAAKSEWWDVGNGFEVSRDSDAKLGHKIRHNGKDIGRFNCWPHTAKTAPGVIGIEARYEQEAFGMPECVAVWSVDAEEWHTMKLWPNSVVGWVK